MIFCPVPVVGIVAYSGTGKTTLLERLIPNLIHKNYRVAAVKHSHHDFEIDKKGKDSDRLRAAGASQVILASQYRTAFIIEEDKITEPDLQKQLNRLDTNKLDLVLVEGFRHFDIPKLEVHRPSLNKPILCTKDKNIIALICDAPPDKTVDVPLLPLNDENKVAEFIVKEILEK